MAVRFSLVAPDRGGSTVIRDVRGFALKFYTEDGIWDLVGNNLPVFFIRDATRFPSFIHAQKRNPATNVFRDPDMFWDFFSLVPESVHLVSVSSKRKSPVGSWSWRKDKALSRLMPFKKSEQNKKENLTI